MAVTISKPNVTLYAHQAPGVKWMVTHGTRPMSDSVNGVNRRPAKGCINADVMGLGKTIQGALAAACHVRADPSIGIVVVCPKSVELNWHRELRQAGVDGAEVFSVGKQPVRPEVVIIGGRERTNYHPLDSLPARYVLIADEAHLYQNLAAKRTKQFLGLARSSRCVAVYMLTGTPLKNGRPSNLFPLLLAARHPLADSKTDFEERFCGATVRRFLTTDALTGESRMRQRYDTSGARNLQELHALTKDFIIRRTHADCPDIPDLIRTLLPVRLDNDQQRAYDAYFAELRQQWRSRMQRREISGEGSALVLLNNLRRAGSLAKVDAAVELAGEVLSEGGKPVLFTSYIETAERIAEYLPQNTPVFHGGLSRTQRENIVADFTAGKVDAFVGVGSAAGTGINLQAGADVFLVDRPWTPGDALQWEYRCKRIGSKADRINSRWLQFGVVDSKIDGIIQRKFGNIEEVLSGNRDSLAFQSLESMAEEIAEAVFG